jgi:hypothetical protein
MSSAVVDLISVDGRFQHELKLPDLLKPQYGMGSPKNLTVALLASRFTVSGMIENEFQAIRPMILGGDRGRS